MKKESLIQIPGSLKNSCSFSSVLLPHSLEVGKSNCPNSGSESARFFPS